MQAADLIAVIPELVLLAAACAVLLIEAFAPRDLDRQGDRTAVLAVTMTGLLGSVAVSLGLWGQHRVGFGGMIMLDQWSLFFKMLFGVAALLVVLMSPRYLEAGGRHLGEYYALLLFAVIGMDLVTGARDFVLLYVSVELMAISSYLLAAFFRYRVRSNEASLKYLVTGSFASALLLYGISLVYGLTARTGYFGSDQVLASLSGGGGGAPLSEGTTTGLVFAMVLVAIGLAFKVSAVPFHMWTPDVYQGAPTPIAAFFSVGPKAAAFAAILAVFSTAFPGEMGDWGVLFLVLSIVTMLGGNLYALVQNNVKRMLAYSSIAHAGYLLVGLAAMGWGEDSYLGRGVLIYLVAYTFMNLGAFGVLAYLKAQRPQSFDYSLKQLAGLGRRSPWAAVLLTLFLISLVGIPGTAGFIGKFYVFGAAVWAGLWWLAVIGVVLSAVSAYYYLRVVVYLFFREPEEDFGVREPIAGGMAAALAVSALATLVIGVAPSWLWDVVSKAFAGLLG